MQINILIVRKARNTSLITDHKKGKKQNKGWMDAKL